METEVKAIVEIRDNAGVWFADCENPEGLAIAAADARVAKLRSEGFTARARLPEAFYRPGPLA